MLTAAHCTEFLAQLGAGAAELKIGIAEHDFSVHNDCAFSADVSEIIRHPGYNSTTYNFDYSVLVLANEIQCSAFVSPVCLPDVSDDPEFYDDKSAVAVGWGATNASTGAMPDILQHVSIRTMGNAECSRAYGSLITENMICAGGQGKDSCYGDSGGKEKS